MALRADCIHFRGDKPCALGRPCEGCPGFAPLPARILIIKCRAQGDVLRTTPLLPALKREYPQSHVTWVVDAESVDLLKHNPLVDRVLAYDLEALLPLLVEKFDLLVSLDKEPGLTSLATKVQAGRKLGFGMNEVGNLTIFNPAAEYAYRLGVDDGLKFRRNQKTYQEVVHEIAEVPFARDEYVFVLPEESREKARRFLRGRRPAGRRPALGLNTGAGAKFLSKQWPFAHYLKLISLLNRKLKTDVFLLGGRREREMNRRLAREARTRVFDTGSENSILEFAGFIAAMDLLVSSDTLGMHLGIALKKPVVALFGPTCPQEIDLYGRGEKLFAQSPCAPCYKPSCSDAKCMKAISPEQVLAAVRKHL